MIGREIRARVFRDTKGFYEQAPPDLVAPQLISFAEKYSGHSILDLGCAVGNYSRLLADRGYEVKGADINPRYVEIARSRGVNAYQIKENLPFQDKSFDTVLVFEVLEHLEDPNAVISEARRVARKNVLFTTPNSSETQELQHQGLIYEHFGDLDHKNFFTEESLRDLLAPHFVRLTVEKGDGINPLGMFPSQKIRSLGRRLMQSGLLKPCFYFRLYAVGELSYHKD